MAYKKAMLRDIPVASAAPFIPMEGMGPHPNIKMGSRIMLRTVPVSMNFIGEIVSPHPLKMLLESMVSKIAGVKINMIVRYFTKH